MRVMLIVSSLYGGGAERVVARLANALCERHEVHIVVLTPLLEKGGIYELDPRVAIHEAAIPTSTTATSATRPFVERSYRILRSVKHRISALGFTHGTGRLGRMMESAHDKATSINQDARWERIRSLKARYGIDVAISFMVGGNLANVNSRSREAVVVSVRNILNTPYTEDTRFTENHHEQIRLASELADKVVAVSKNVGREQVEVYGIDPGKIDVIYNPVNIGELRRKALAPVDDPEFSSFRTRHEHVILAMGRHVYQKGHWHLIRALGKVLETEPSCGLVILGRGPLTARLEAVIAANGLQDHVLLAGFHEPFPYMARCDVFCSSSLFEGFSNAMLEAMACGMPIVSTDCNSGPRELMAPESDSSIHATSIEKTPYGFLTPPLSGDFSLTDEPLEPEEEALAQALADLLADEKLRETCRANASVRIEDFATERILAQWRQTIEGLQPAASHP